MNSKQHKLLMRFTFLLLAWLPAQTGLLLAQQNDSTSGTEIMTRGPVHEAFAGIVAFDPKPGVIVNAQPPSAINEVPPEQRLKGENVAWIPGYWAWDEDRNDFLWVSGIWRNLPPGRQWFPGYWAEVGGRYQWSSGYWENEAAKEVTYLPEPPRSVEAGPNIQSPSNNQTWIPGTWIWRNGRYAWRAGYWATVRESWSWTPSYYRWTPHGYVYVDGYWDYAVARRGMIFAPVHFERDSYLQPSFHYSPTTVISLALFAEHLFLRPSYDHYYFGDYYGPEYRNRGYFSSVSYRSTNRGYDPIYAYRRWQNRSDPNWEASRLRNFENLRDHSAARPPRTYAAQAALPATSAGISTNSNLAVPLNQYVTNGGTGDQSFQPVGPKDRARLASQTKDIQKITTERQQLETQVAPVAGAAAKIAAEPSRLKIARSPIAAKQSARPGKSGAPPARLEPSNPEPPKTTSSGVDGTPQQPSTSEIRVPPTTPTEPAIIPSKSPARGNRKADATPKTRQPAVTQDIVPTETKHQATSIPSRTEAPAEKQPPQATTTTETKATPKVPSRQKAPSIAPEAAKDSPTRPEMKKLPAVRQTPFRQTQPTPPTQVQQKQPKAVAPQAQRVRPTVTTPPAETTTTPATSQDPNEDFRKKKNRSALPRDLTR